MFGQLGDITFQGINTPLAESVTIGGNWSEITRYGGAPALQNTGRALVSRSLDVRLHSAFGKGTVSAQLTQLQNYVQSGTVLPFQQAGVNRGDVVLQTISYTVEIQNPDGELISVLATLNLLEYVKDAQQNQAEQIQQGFATNPEKITPVRVLATGVTESAVVSLTADRADAESVAAIAATIAARDDTSERPKLLQQAEQAAKRAGELAREAKAVYDQAQNLQAIAANLGNAFASAEANADLLAEAARSGDITNSLNAADNLATSSEQIRVAKRPLDKFVISRKPV
jgi:hypothetical protein